MKRRRHRLEISTFPFLAVLLCAMGSLILLLLVLDRRAKIVALHKAHEDAGRTESEKLRRAQELARLQAETERIAAERQAEWQSRRQQLHALLDEQEQELLGNVQQVQNQLQAASTKAQAEEAQLLNLKAQLKIVNDRLFGGRQKSQAQQQAVAQAAVQTKEAQRELARQTADLLQLEQTLANLKALRERQKQTYSLVPYFGKRGDNRRPIYVECDASGLVFHPDRLSLESFQMTQQRVRAEVEQRIARQKTEVAPEAGKEAPVPYLLMLVRPNGISNYYLTQQALAGLKVDFGYEFVEQDWVFDFGDGAAQPWQMVKAPPLLATVPFPPSVPSPPPPRFGSVAPPGSPGALGQQAGAGSPRPPGTGLASGSESASTVGVSGTMPSGVVPGPVPGSPLAARPNGSGSAGGAAAGGQPSGELTGTAPGAAKGQASGFGAAALSAKGGGPPPVPGLPQFPGNGGSTVPVPPGGSRTLTSGPPGNAGPVGVPGTAGMPGGSPPTQVGGADGPPGNAGQAGVPGMAGMPSGSPATQVGGAGAPPGDGKAAASGPPGNAGQAGVAGTAGTPTGLPPTRIEGSEAPSGGGQILASGSPDNAGPPGASGTAGISSGLSSGQAGGSEAPPAMSANSTGATFSPPGSFGKSKNTGPPPPPLGRLLGNRDWIIYIECSSTAAVVKQGAQRFTVEALSAAAKGEHPLARAVREIIARRQASVLPGEPPYRPLLRFQVQPDGLPSYYLAYPLLAPLALPMTRENVQ
jgi:hypothetical protein